MINQVKLSELKGQILHGDLFTREDYFYAYALDLTSKIALHQASLEALKTEPVDVEETQIEVMITNLLMTDQVLPKDNRIAVTNEYFEIFKKWQEPGTSMMNRLIERILFYPIPLNEEGLILIAGFCGNNLSLAEKLLSYHNSMQSESMLLFLDTLFSNFCEKKFEGDWEIEKIAKYLQDNKSEIHKGDAEVEKALQQTLVSCYNLLHVN